MHTNPATRPFSLAQTGRRGLRATSVALLSLALIAGAALVATPASAAPAVTAAANTGSISGVVTSAKTGEPLSDVYVTLLGEFDPLLYDEDYLGDDMTDAAGQYSFPRLPEGDYRLVFESYADDYDPETGEPIYSGDSYLTQYFGGEPGDETGDVSPISVGTTTVSADLALSVAGKYTGRVLTSAGKPAAAVNVYAITEDEENSYSGQQTRTAKDGTYTLSNLAYGETIIYTQPTKTAPSTLTTPAPITAAKPVVKVAAIKLSVGSFITGRLLSSTGKPVARALVTAEKIGDDANPFDTFFSGNGLTDNKGNYLVGPLLAGKYAPAAYTDIEEGSAKVQYLGGSTDVFLAKTVSLSKPGSTVTREFRLAKQATLSGVVTDADGVRVKNVYVSAIQLDSVSNTFGFSGSESANNTNAKGQYTISNLNPGSYLAGFGMTTTQSGAPIKKTIALKPGTNTLHARLASVTTVSGIVTSSTGAALKGVAVSIVPVNGTECPHGALPYFEDEEYSNTLTSATGSYSIAVPAGEWALRFIDPAGRVSSAYLGGGTYPSDSATTVLSTSSAIDTLPNQNQVLSTSGANVSAYVHTVAGGDEIEGSTTIERLVDGAVVDSTDTDSCGGYYSGFDGWSINDAFPMKKLADGDYRVTIAPYVATSGFETSDTIVEFTVAGNVVTTVDGELALDNSSLGDITLATPTRSTAPEDLEQPTIFAPEGAVVGATLSAVTDYPGIDPDWSTYQWFRNGRPIAGAWSPEYVVQSGDVGAVLTFAFDGYTESGEYLNVPISTPSAVVQGAIISVPEDAPTITGTGRVGGTLTAVPAKGDPKGTTYGYQWSINGQELIAVTTKTFTPRIQDLGETITVTVTKTLPDAGVTTGATSAGVVIKTGKAIVLSKAVLLVDGKSTSKLRLGKTLSVAVKGLPADGVGVSYQWQVNRGKGWSSLAGKTSNTLALPKKKSSTNKVGSKYRVVVSVERSGHDKSTPVNSNALTAAKASKK